MPNNFISTVEGDLEKVFVTDYGVIDRLAAASSLWVWGNNTDGQLGTNDLVHRSSPVQTISFGTNWKQIALSLDDNNSVAIKTDGTLWVWGGNSAGQLGTNDRVNRSSPVQTITFGTDWKQATVGSLFMAAIKTDGTLWVWGSNSVGQLGTRDIVDRSSPVQTIAYGKNWKQVVGTSSGIMAIRTDNTLWGTGSNVYGELGTNDRVNRSSPVQTITYSSDWKTLATKMQPGIGAIKTDGTLWTWGDNRQGILASNDTVSRSSPAQTVAYGNNWKQVEFSTYNGSAVKTDGTLWMWGSASAGVLGNNIRLGSYFSPIQTVALGTNWKQTSVGTLTAGAIKTDGTLWTWGDANWGKLGNETDLISRSSPAQTVTYGTNWKQISMNDNSALGLYFGANNDSYPSIIN